MLIRLSEKIKASNYIHKFKNTKDKNKYIFISIILLIFISVFCMYFVSTNESYYNKTIAKITSVINENSEAQNQDGKIENIQNQHIMAVIMNGSHKGEEVSLENKSSFSQVDDLNYTVNDEVFISIQQDANKHITDAKIIDFKRDNYIVYIAILFILLILLIGGIKGFKSLTSVVINIFIFSAVIGLFLSGYNLTLISVIASIFFITFSIAIVSGINNKTFSAIAGTVAGTLISILIALAVIKINNWNGVHFEEMEFLTCPPEPIFLVEILIGTLGGIMDIAISISSSINEIYEKNPYIEMKKLISSAKEIGKDIMGTMSNTLVFAYISGSIPMILLLLRNGYPISYIMSINLSLEFVRALTGSIGIVLSIPITIYTSILILKKQKIGEA